MASMTMTPTDAAFAAQSRAPQILIGSIVPALFASIFVLARFYSRAIIMKNWGHDDSWILFSWIIGSIIITILNGELVVHGSGRHLIVQKPDDLLPTIQLAFAGRVLYQTCIGTTKLGICAFYMRIFQDRKSKIVIWVMSGIIASFTLAFVISVFFQCQPIDGVWSLMPAKCIAQAPANTASGILNILADVALLVFIFPKIITLHIASRQKIGLLAVISLSFLAIIAAIIRLDRTLQVFGNSKDQPWDSYDITIWSAVEVNTGLFCASAAAIKPLLRKLAPGLLGTVSDATSRSNTHSRNKIGTYGTGTHVSRARHTSDAFELSSQTELGTYSGAGKTTNKFWADSSEGQKKNLSDDDSETGVLGLQSARGISKTVSVTVEGRKRSGDGNESGGENGVFEHV